MTQRYQGGGGAPGIAIGRIFRSIPQTPPLPEVEEDTSTALARFAAAQHSAAEHLIALAERLRAEHRTDEAEIFDAQALFVEDPIITDEVTRRIREEHESLSQALDNTITQVRATFEALDDAYMRERSADITAVGRMIRDALYGRQTSLDHLPTDAIIVAPDLTPAETAELRGRTIAGFATAYGGPTGHTAILARSWGIPAVVGLGPSVLDVPDTTDAILDGDASCLIVQPDSAERSHYEQHHAQERIAQVRRQALRDQPGQLSDGHHVALWANIGRPDEARLALEHGAEGIGLFRTEFLFLERTAPPGEDEQYAAYRSTLETMAGRTVVVRTLDIGGDKPLPYIQMPAEANPFLGIRGLRLCMRHPQLLHTQLRALLRAAVSGDLWIMFPMISTPDDLSWGRAQFYAVAESLAAEGIPYRLDVPLGIMIETPAAAITADLMEEEADFFSLGSNDLTQYTMAADRGMSELSAAYPHTAPAVMRLIAETARVANRIGTPLGVCGELASIPLAAAILAGLGVDELSMTPSAIPLVKEHLLTLTLDEAKQLALQAMGRPMNFSG